MYNISVIGYTVYKHTHNYMCLYVKRNTDRQIWGLGKAEMHLRQNCQVLTAFISSSRSSSSNSKNVYFHFLFSFQLPERAIFQIKQYNSASSGVSEWQLEEAQVFWAKKEQSLALSILKQMIKKLDASCTEVHFFSIG